MTNQLSLKCRVKKTSDVISLINGINDELPRFLRKSDTDIKSIISYVLQVNHVYQDDFINHKGWFLIDLRNYKDPQVQYDGICEFSHWVDINDQILLVLNQIPRNAINERIMEKNVWSKWFIKFCLVYF